MQRTPRSTPLTDQSSRFVAYEYETSPLPSGLFRFIVTDSVNPHDKCWMTHDNHTDGQEFSRKVARALNMLHEKVANP